MMLKLCKKKNWMRKSLTVTVIASIFGCTGQLPNSFRFKQQEQAFSTTVAINTKIDLLWVIDNSASMDVSQKKLRDGFETFALKYMKPTWNIRLAVITSDIYLADAAFSPFLNSTVGGTTGYVSNYILNRPTPFVNPAWNPTLVNTATGEFESGVKFKELVPAWRENYSRLMAGIHDGPITGLCFEKLPYFFQGVTDCAVRDDQAAYNGPDNCLNPGGGESSDSQCVNTLQNDTVRSGKAIIETMPPEGTPPNAAWTDQLIKDSIVNLTTGSVGHGSERGIGSLLQMIEDNESTATAFFRQNSIRGIIFVADEDDQTMVIPDSPPSGFDPFTYYKCDQASLLAMNTASRITGNNGYCCNVPANNCFLGYDGLSCDSKTVDGYVYTPSTCADPDRLLPISDVKSQLDTFFTSLDGSSEGASSYFITSIVANTAQAIQDLQTARDAIDATVGAVKTQAVDRGDRYIELGDLVGNGSLVLNIAESDYTPILEAIGNAIITKVGTFVLDRAPTSKDDMIVKVVHDNGSQTYVPNESFEIDGKILQITDLEFLLSLEESDTFIINYQPNGAF